LRDKLGIQRGADWDAFAPESAEGRFAAATVARLFPAHATPPELLNPSDVPNELPFATQGKLNTQDAFGRLLVRLADEPALRARIVTASPDVSVSTNLGGWINKTGVFSLQPAEDYETEAQRLLHWKPGPNGQHIELGISEMNL